MSLWNGANMARVATMARRYSTGSPFMSAYTRRVLRRVAGVATRVVSGLPSFVSEMATSTAFARGVSPEEKCAMFVMTQFPLHARVDLFEFATGATAAVKRVYEAMYADDASEADSTAFLRSIAIPDCFDVLNSKRDRQARQLALADARHTVIALDNLEIKTVGIDAVDVTIITLSEDDAKATGYSDEEWLRVSVHVQALEHVRTRPTAGVGIEDRSTWNTAFRWTFEANVTHPESVEWLITAVSPFEQRPARLTKANKQQ